ncbi:MAG: hypothetical protein KIS67_14365 [Verrucomicrobiae bacterium]|nr:hypothetical protein [Verrucomicrobiae bacterium]
MNGQNTLHPQVMDTLRQGRLFAGKKTELRQPPLFNSHIKEATATARGAEFTARIYSLKDKYGPNADTLVNLTKEILEKCNPPKS